jgi:secreted Zn-dependent insulinase-like peptidase
VIGHEGKGSFLSMLIDLGLATSLMATDVTKCAGSYGELTISITLTPKGVEKHCVVIKLVEDFIKVLIEKGPQFYFFEELKLMSIALFDTVPPSIALSTAKSLSNTLAKSPEMTDEIVENILVKDIHFFKFDAEMISETLNQMTLDNAYTILLS